MKVGYVFTHARGDSRAQSIGIRHLRGNHALPNEVIQLFQIIAPARVLFGNVGHAHGLMRLLRVFAFGLY